MPTATLPLSQSVVPAPPPRLLQFRSREPSSVPACPYPLCQKPIALTKTRRERGVTVWIVCGLLFLCNTYWTTQAVISQFSNPNSKDRILSQNTMKATDARWTVRGEVSHLVKGFLGFKTHRYKSPKMVDYQRHMMELKRPFVATVGVVQDEQNGIRMLLSFIVMVVMAIIRWWLCLTPLLVRPLFDTVHICPHAHPYPYPEEIELERRTLEGELEEEAGLNSRIGTTVQHASSTDTMSATISRDGYGDEKKRLQERDEADATAAVGRLNGQAQRRQSGQGSVPEPSSANMMTATTGVVSGSGPGFAPESAPQGPAMSRFRFFRRVRTIQQELKEEGHRRVREIGQELQEQGRRRVREIQQELREQGQQALSATMTEIKKNRVSSRMARAIKKAQERRNKVIKASQDIGRYSLLYQLGALFKMDGWKQAVLAPTKIQSEAYED
ncbi:hypothetical protein BGZ98_001432 [Dissophora globulifera]|nr:hypothetical protein BGZ98_001432 [Dissophora globulifera]